MTDPDTYRWDVFISYASEDRAKVAFPLAEGLQDVGVRVWLDRALLTVGDSLSRSIDEGLRASRYGVVVLSPSFFGKHWPERELSGLAQREARGRKVVLPIWYDVGEVEVRGYSPTLADRVALRWHGEIAPLVAELVKVVDAGLEPETRSPIGGETEARFPHRGASRGERRYMPLDPHRIDFIVNRYIAKGQDDAEILSRLHWRGVDPKYALKVITRLRAVEAL